ncbi:DUF6262 family protein [Caenispirillum bisanense]|uniref:DUF6262 family protein n=1 Tax=Caenispirillum bisanense TaxID=414052 RepID=UPI0031E39E7F
MAKRLSGAEVGAANVEKLRRYLASVASLPARGEQVHVSAIALAAGIDRQVLYKNPECRRLLEEAVAAKGLRGVKERPVQTVDEGRVRLERRVADLERANVALLAENAALRAKLRRYGHIEVHLIETGRLAR